MSPTYKMVNAIRHKYRELFRRQPNVRLIGTVFMTGESKDYPGFKRVALHFTEKFDQATLPEADRIPDCLEGVPILILEEPNDTSFGSTSLNGKGPSWA